MYVSPEVAELLSQAFALAENARFEYVTPELILYAACRNKAFAQAFQNCDGSVRRLDFQLKSWLEENMEQMPENDGAEDSENAPEFSQGLVFVLSCAWEAAQNSGKSAVELPHVLHAMYRLPESYAVYFMQLQGVEQARLLQEMTIAAQENAEGKNAGRRSPGPTGGSRIKAQANTPADKNLSDDEDGHFRRGSLYDAPPDEEAPSRTTSRLRMGMRRKMPTPASGSNMPPA